MSEKALYAPLLKYGNYLSIVPAELQKEWCEYYGLDFVLAHVGEARLYEMASVKKDRDRSKFLTTWLINARSKVEETKVTRDAYAMLAREMKRKSDMEDVMTENRGV